MIKNHNSKMSTTERKIAWNEKNIILHQKLKNNWTPNNMSAFCRSSVLGVFQIKKIEIPMRIYNAVQTGPNK